MKLLSAILFFGYLVLGVACSSENFSESGEVKVRCDNGELKTHCKTADYINWNSVPDRYNPRLDSHDFVTGDLEQINLRLLGFSKDVRIVYDKSLVKKEATLDVYSVSFENKNSPIPDDIEMAPGKLGVDVRFRYYGSFSNACSIKVTNQKISELSGACIAKIVLRLPKGSKLEVYNMDQLLSKRFVAMKNQALIDGVDDVIGNDEKHGVVDAYLKSHKDVGSKPVLYTYELEEVLEEFTWADDQHKVLKKLHRFVEDRENLEAMIEEVFSTFEQDKAKKIVGIK